MSVQRYIDQYLDGVKKAEKIENPVDMITAMALIFNNNYTKDDPLNEKRGSGCLTDEEIAAFIEQKNRWQGYDRAVRHMADCDACREKTLEVASLLSTAETRAPASLVEKTFTRALAQTGSSRIQSFARRFRAPIAIAASVALAIAALLATGIIPSKSRTYVTFFMGSVHITSNGEPVRTAIKLLLNDADAITTGPHSFVLLQMDDSTVLRIAENSLVTINSLKSKDSREIGLGRGRVLARVKKLDSGDIFRVVSPAAVATVLGTEFSVSSRPGISTIAVRRGEVKVTTPSAAGKDMIHSGETLIITDSKKKTAITDRDANELKNMCKIPIIDGIKRRSQEEIRDIMASSLGVEAMPERTLAELKAKYGHIDTLIFYNNRVITGTIVSRGVNYTVVTPGGVIVVPARQIRSIKVE
ncbi:MAG: FecR domain-containing protein [Spirochaetes bacterium]|nr:FecR domain-containing protein [Spirochaetota bacterium]